MLVLLAALVAAPVNATLTLSSPKTTLVVGEQLPFSVSITNKGKSPMLVAAPNDGSSWHWRTPYTGFAVREGRGPDFPKDTPKITEPRCGNVNPINENELFDLAPGKTWQMPTDWIFDKPVFQNPGVYRVVFYYENAPQGLMRGFESDHTKVVERIRASQPYQLRSNELRITVKAP